MSITAPDPARMELVSASALGSSFWKKNLAVRRLAWPKASSGAAAAMRAHSQA